MNTYKDYDCIVIGSGPNGLAAAITLQAHGFKTLVVEKSEEIGGGMRSEELLQAGTVHDVCSAIHPMGLGSAFFRALKLEELGLEWVQPEIPCLHLMNKNESVALYRSLEETCDQFTVKEARRYRSLIAPFIASADALFDDVLLPINHWPRHPLLLARFGLRALMPASMVSHILGHAKAAALFSGMAAHSFMPLDKMLSGAMGFILSIAGHAKGWPLAKGGSGKIAFLLAEKFKQLGGAIECCHEVSDLREFPDSCTLFANTSAPALAKIGATLLPQTYIQRLQQYRYGPSAYKLDYILSEPIPWREQRCLKASTIHLSGTAKEVAVMEAEIWRGSLPPALFTLVAQPTLFDATRSRSQKQVAWIYAHVPHAYHENLVERIEGQMEIFAPGFKDCIESRFVTTPADFAHRNPNLVGGSIIGGVADFSQTIGRPVVKWDPYRTPNARIYLCSAATPPGAGVHGMCGVNAAKSFLRAKSTALRSPFDRM